MTLLSFFRWSVLNGPRPQLSNISEQIRKINKQTIEPLAAQYSVLKQEEEHGLEERSRLVLATKYEFETAIEFFDYIKAELKSVHEPKLVDLCLSILNYLFEKEERNKDQVAELFKIIIKSAPDKAIEFYNNCKVKKWRAKYPEKSCNTSILFVHQYIDDITKALGSIHEPEQLYPLFSQALDCPALTTACLYWLVQQGVSTYDIQMESTIIGNYYLAHPHHVDVTTSKEKQTFDELTHLLQLCEAPPIVEYQISQTNPPLSAIAGGLCHNQALATEKTFLKQRRKYQDKHYYSEQHDLSKCYKLFSHHYLLNLLREYRDNPTEKVLLFLQPWFRTHRMSDNTPVKLNKLLNFIATQSDNSALFETITEELLDSYTVQQCLSNKCFALLHFESIARNNIFKVEVNGLNDELATDLIAPYITNLTSQVHNTSEQLLLLNRVIRQHYWVKETTPPHSWIAKDLSPNDKILKTVFFRKAIELTLTSATQNTRLIDEALLELFVLSGEELIAEQLTRSEKFIAHFLHSTDDLPTTFLKAVTAWRKEVPFIQMLKNMHPQLRINVPIISVNDNEFYIYFIKYHLSQSTDINLASFLYSTFFKTEGLNRRDLDELMFTILGTIADENLLQQTVQLLDAQSSETTLADVFSYATDTNVALYEQAKALVKKQPPSPVNWRQNPAIFDLACKNGIRTSVELFLDFITKNDESDRSEYLTLIEKGLLLAIEHGQTTLSDYFLRKIKADEPNPRLLNSGCRLIKLRKIDFDDRSNDKDSLVRSAYAHMVRAQGNDPMIHNHNTIDLLTALEKTSQPAFVSYKDKLYYYKAKDWAFNEVIQNDDNSELVDYIKSTIDQIEPGYLDNGDEEPYPSQLADFQTLKYIAKLNNALLIEGAISTAIRHNQPQLLSRILTTFCTIPCSHITQNIIINAMKFCLTMNHEINLNHFFDLFLKLPDGHEPTQSMIGEVLNKAYSTHATAIFQKLLNLKGPNKPNQQVIDKIIAQNIGSTHSYSNDVPIDILNIIVALPEDLAPNPINIRNLIQNQGIIPNIQRRGYLNVISCLIRKDILNRQLYEKLLDINCTSKANDERHELVRTVKDIFLLDSNKKTSEKKKEEIFIRLCELGHNNTTESLLSLDQVKQNTVLLTLGFHTACENALDVQRKIKSQILGFHAIQQDEHMKIIELILAQFQDNNQREDLIVGGINTAIKLNRQDFIGKLLVLCKEQGIDSSACLTKCCKQALDNKDEEGISHLLEFTKPNKLQREGQNARSIFITLTKTVIFEREILMRLLTWLLSEQKLELVQTILKYNAKDKLLAQDFNSLIMQLESVPEKLSLSSQTLAQKWEVLKLLYQLDSEKTCEHLFSTRLLKYAVDTKQYSVALDLIKSFHYQSDRDKLEALDQLLISSMTEKNWDKLVFILKEIYGMQTTPYSYLKRETEKRIIEQAQTNNVSTLLLCVTQENMKQQLKSDVADAELMLRKKVAALHINDDVATPPDENITAIGNKQPDIILSSIAQLTDNLQNGILISPKPSTVPSATGRSVLSFFEPSKKLQDVEKKNPKQEEANDSEVTVVSANSITMTSILLVRK